MAEPLELLTVGALLVVVPPAVEELPVDAPAVEALALLELVMLFAVIALAPLVVVALLLPVDAVAREAECPA